MKGLFLLAFLPEEALPLLFAGCGLALIFGFRKVAGTLFMIGIALAFLPVVLEPFLDLLPLWLLYTLFGVFILSLITSAMTFVIGKRATNKIMLSTLKNLIAFPFRLAGGLKTNRRL